MTINGMDSTGRHFEPYVYLAGLDHDRALIAWGGFFFDRQADDYNLVDDEQLEGRTESIGERSEPYGESEVRLFDASGQLVVAAQTSCANHVWIEGLQPDTQYRYDIYVNGRQWLEGERYDWIRRDGRASMRPSGRQYRCQFRTFPAVDSYRPFSFAVLGDFGIGIFSDHDDARRQVAVAEALSEAISLHDVRLVLTTGDNIYLSHDTDDATGAEDDDWFYSFYQPYRYVLDRVPFYPAVGNHDGAETENSDDRAQLDDNYFLRQRFAEERNASRASIDPGLFYRFDFGATATFVCLDTTLDEGCETRYFDKPSHEDFLRDSFPVAQSRDGRWRIPYSHHPVYCAGPEHSNTDGMEATLVPLFERSDVRLVLAGHEHNFQYSERDGVHYLVSGAGGKLRTGTPTRFREARCLAWAAAGHFLVISLDMDRAIVHVLTTEASGAVVPLVAQTPEGQPFQTPLVITR